MAWNSPLTFVTGNVLTAAQLNAQVRDNMSETAPAKATTAGRLIVTTGANAVAERDVVTDSVATSQTTSSTSYVDLATAGPAVTVTTGTKALVTIMSRVTSDTAGGAAFATYAVSGATTIAAADYTRGLVFTISTANQLQRIGVSYLETGLTAGSNTFTMKYRAGGTASSTAAFASRTIIVQAL